MTDGPITPLWPYRRLPDEWPRAKFQIERIFSQIERHGPHSSGGGGGGGGGDEIQRLLYRGGSGSQTVPSGSFVEIDFSGTEKRIFGPSGVPKDALWLAVVEMSWAGSAAPAGLRYVELYRTNLAGTFVSSIQVNRSGGMTAQHYQTMTAFVTQLFTGENARVRVFQDSGSGIFSERCLIRVYELSTSYVVEP